MRRRVVSVSPSAYWSTAIVIETDCGHRHARPASWGARVGWNWDCNKCEDEPGAMSERKARAIGVLLDSWRKHMSNDDYFDALDAIAELLKR